MIENIAGAGVAGASAGLAANAGLAADVALAALPEPARGLVAAILTGDLVALEQAFAPDVRFRALTPRRFREAASAADARAVVAGWFEESDGLILVASEAVPVGAKVSFGYRFRLRRAGVPSLIEQRVMATITDGRLADVTLVCSGFEPLADDAGPSAGERNPSGAAAPGSSAAAGRPAAVARLDATGHSCATLTPAVRDAIRQVSPGALLEVTTDDPETEAGLQSWARLTGHALIGVERPGGATSRVLIRRATPPASPPGS